MSLLVETERNKQTPHPEKPQSVGGRGAPKPEMAACQGTRSARRLHRGLTSEQRSESTAGQNNHWSTLMPEAGHVKWVLKGTRD